MRKGRRAAWAVLKLFFGSLGQQDLFVSQDWKQPSLLEQPFMQEPKLCNMQHPQNQQRATSNVEFPK